MFNKIILVGNLTRDPELRYLPSGSAVCNTGIATNRKFKSQTGEQKEEVCFVDITFFGRSAEIANQYLKRGSKILVEGRLKLDQWTDQSGAKRSKHSVSVDSLQMLDSKGQADHGNDDAPAYGEPRYSNDQQNMPPRQPQQKGSGNTSYPEIDINDDEIPF